MFLLFSYLTVNINVIEYVPYWMIHPCCFSISLTIQLEIKYKYKNIYKPFVIIRVTLNGNETIFYFHRLIFIINILVTSGFHLRLKRICEHRFFICSNSLKKYKMHCQHFVWLARNVFSIKYLKPNIYMKRIITYNSWKN